MAVIVCPECGEKISSTVKSCIHCGCKINACPECGTVTQGEVTNCPECGYTFVKKYQQVDNKQDVGDIASVSKVFNSSNPFAKFLSYSIVTIVLIVITLAFIGFGLGDFFVWMGSSDFITTYESTYKNVETLLVFAAIFAIVTSLYNNLGFYLYTEIYCGFLTKNKVDVKNVLQKSMSIDFDELTADGALEHALNVKNTMYADMQQSSIIYKTQERNRALIQVAVFSIAVIFLAVFVINNLQACMNITFWKGKDNFEFSMIENWWLLIVAVVAFIAAKIIENRFEKTDEEALDNWVQKNYTEYAAVYENKIKNCFDNMFEQIDQSDRTR